MDEIEYNVLRDARF